MFHKGTRTTGGSLPSELQTQVNNLLDEFAEILVEQTQQLNLRRAVVRARLPCNIIAVLDKTSLHVGAEKASGMPTSSYIDQRENEFTHQQIFEAAKWDFGFDNPFVISFPSDLISKEKDERTQAISQISLNYIDSEVRRIEKEMNLIQISPIFGPAEYEIDPRLAFVLMPFKKDLTEVYENLVKPTIEKEKFGLVCKRADDIKSNRAIIQDIWKSICEARVIIADLTGLNPNVMYELGVAHTLGKESIIIYRKDEEIRFPFDLAHIRRIEYKNTPVGGTKLVKDLEATLDNVLHPERLGD